MSPKDRRKSGDKTGHSAGRLLALFGSIQPPCNGHRFPLLILQPRPVRFPAAWSSRKAPAPLCGVSARSFSTLGPLPPLNGCQFCLLYWHTLLRRRLKSHLDNESRYITKHEIARQLPRSCSTLRGRQQAYISRALLRVAAVAFLPEYVYRRSSGARLHRRTAPWGCVNEGCTHTRVRRGSRLVPVAATASG